MMVYRHQIIKYSIWSTKDDKDLHTKCMKVHSFTHRMTTPTQPSRVSLESCLLQSWRNALNRALKKKPQMQEIWRQNAAPRAVCVCALCACVRVCSSSRYKEGLAGVWDSSRGSRREREREMRGWRGSDAEQRARELQRGESQT